MKKLIILESFYIRNYLTTHAFDLIIGDDTHVVIIDSSEEFKLDNDYSDVISFIDSGLKSINFFNQLIFDLRMVKNLDKSPSFRYRYKRIVCKEIDLESFSKYRIINSYRYKKNKDKFSTCTNFLLVNAIRFTRFIKFLSTLPYRFILFILSKQYIYTLIQNYRMSRVSCYNLNSFVSNYNPDIVIMPNSAFSVVGEDVISLSNKGTNFKTFFLIDNWDNLSSKSIFWNKPDYLGVWGEQSREHAVNIQGVDFNNVYVLGTPRYSVYEKYKYTNESPKKIYEFPYILFLGTLLSYDEIGALKKISQVLKDNRELFPAGCKIVYRPHPWGHGMRLQKEFNQLDDNIVIDKQFAEQFALGMSLNFQPDLKYYVSILSHATIVVGALTTMLLEALLLGKNVVVVAYDDGGSSPPSKNLKFYKHFESLENIPSLFFVHNKDDMRSAMLAAKWVEWTESDWIDIDNKLLYYIYHSDGMTFSQRLANCVKKIENK